MIKKYLAEIYKNIQAIVPLQLKNQHRVYRNTLIDCKL
jgi:hypothetical protein